METINGITQTGEAFTVEFEQGSLVTRTGVYTTAHFSLFIDGEFVDYGPIEALDNVLENYECF